MSGRALWEIVGWVCVERESVEQLLYWRGHGEETARYA
jgi:hypothetical protein